MGPEALGPRPKTQDPRPKTQDLKTQDPRKDSNLSLKPSPNSVEG